MNGQTAVLVVDDEEGMRDMLAEALGYEGFEVATAESGNAAVEALRRRNFDVAITDLLMPGMDGVATLDALRRKDPLIEVIVTTGFISPDTALKCMKHGAFDYVRKPFDLSALVLVLERAAKKKQLEAEVAVYRATRVLLETLELPKLIQEALALAERIVNADEGGLVLPERRPPGLGFHRFGEEARPSDFVLSQLLDGVRSGGPVILPATESYRSALAYPLPSRIEGLGALALLRREGSPVFLASEFRKGTVLAAQLAPCLDNARRYDELGQQGAQAEKVGAKPTKPVSQ